jgi:hypothetical protein
MITDPRIANAQEYQWEERMDRLEMRVWCKNLFRRVSQSELGRHLMILVSRVDLGCLNEGNIR